MKKRFKNLRMSNQFLICFVMIIIINTIGIGFFTNLFFSNILLNKAGEYASEIIEQAGMTIASDLQSAENTTFTISYDDTVQRVIKDSPLLKNASALQKRVHVGPMVNVVVNHFNYQMIRSITVTDIENNILDTVCALSRNYWKFGTTGRLEEMLSIAAKAEGQPVWFNNADSYGTLTIVRLINCIETFKPIGYLVLDVDISRILRTLNAVDLEGNWELELMNLDGSLITSTTGKTLNSHNLVQNSLKDEAAQSDSGYFVSEEPDGMEKLYCYYHLRPYDIYLVGTVHTTAINTDAQTVISLIVSIALVMLLFSLMVAFMLSRSITRPIRKIAGSMKQVGEGNYSISVKVDSNDEIGVLSRTFNNMVANIRTLTEKVSSVQLLQKEAEFKALQAQINPHFLYNVLETINWMAMSRGATDICRMVSAFGGLLRISVSNKKEFITISEELAYVRDYVYIQNIRHSDSITCEMDFPEELLSHNIPKLIVQPVVENAIIHGLEKVEGGGRILISGRIENHGIVIEVSDNGVGMSLERASEILSNHDHHSSVGHLGMGLANVHDRLCLYYGIPYGVSVDSVIGKGTTVRILLPKEEDHA